ncbi:MAG: AMP-binding protein, partial [Gammaproteobacteria bacterium]|nr:AMP-binding protein [Gammaproteobacteria bacterium]
MSDNLHRTLPEVLRDAADRYPDRAAIVDRQAAISFSVLKAGADRLSKSVIASGLEPGERFVIWAPNIAEWVVAALAGQQVGGVLVPVNTRFKGEEAGDIVRRSGARLAFAMGEFLGVDYAALLTAQPCPGLRRVVRLSGSGDELSLDAFVQLGDAVSDAELQRRIEAVGPTDISDVLYTSGTTGAPKGAMTTHGQNIATFMEWSEAVGLTAEDRYLVVNPFFHSFGYKAGWLAALLRGAAIYPEAQF